MVGTIGRRACAWKVGMLELGYRKGEVSDLLVLTDFVASSLKGKKDGSQGLERSVNPWNAPKKICILKGCEKSEKRPNDSSHPFRMRSSFPTGPGIYASLQSLATISNPSGGTLCSHSGKTCATAREC